MRCSTSLGRTVVDIMIMLRVFGNIWEGFGENNAQTILGEANKNSVVTGAYLNKIAGVSYHTVLFKPLSGIPNQRKYIVQTGLSNDYRTVIGR